MRTALIFAIVLPLMAQYPGQQSPYPGGQRYPSGGGGMPRIPGLPGRGKKAPDKSKTGDAASKLPLEELKGALRQIDAKSITVTTDDNRNVTAKRIDKTKFTAKGVEADPAKWKAGDRVRIEATRDDEGFYYAVNVDFEREGTGQERSAAAGHVEVSSQVSEEPRQRGEDDRPILRRAGGKETATAEAPKAAEPRGGEPKAAEPEEPQELRRGPLAALDEKPMDTDDPGRPRVRRGRPEPRVVASARIPEARPATPAPPPTEPKLPAWKTPEYTEEKASAPAGAPPKAEDADDPRIVKAREATLAYIASLPNYYCRQQIARYVSSSAPASWRAVDIVSAALVFEGGRERYTNLQINGKAVKKGMEELSGSWSTGEFATVLTDLFHPSTAAEFRLLRTASIGGRDATVFDFEVDQANSHWRVQVPAQVFQPAYKGSVWIDRETSKVLRIEMQARKVPKAFPLDTVESAVEFGFVRIGDQQYLLPTHAEVLSCIRGTSDCSRNVIDFRNYHKYTGESTITFSDSNIEYK